MPVLPPVPEPAADDAATGTGVRRLTPAAERALAEARERRQRAEAARSTAPKEIDGQDGPDPVRYGDWEKGGIASDF
jgi:hypothetical protein